MTAAPSLPETYRFHANFHAPILTGAKPFTLRMARKGGHVEVGERLLLAPTSGAPFAEGLCVYRATVVFSAQGLHRVIDPTFRGDAGDRLYRLFQSAEQAAPHAQLARPQIARLDGFGDWAQFAAWHIEHGISEHGRCWREAIGFAEVAALAPAEA